MKQPTAMERADDLSKKVMNMRIALWVLIGYVVILTVSVWGIQVGLWQANQSNYEMIKSQESKKIPCSSEINENCEIFVRK